MCLENGDWICRHGCEAPVWRTAGSIVSMSPAASGARGHGGRTLRSVRVDLHGTCHRLRSLALFSVVVAGQDALVRLCVIRRTNATPQSVTGRSTIVSPMMVSD